jgi:hypothetical protein
MITSSQLVHRQHDPVGEGRSSVFNRCNVGTGGVKTLAVPVDQPIHSMDIAYQIVETRKKNDCLKEFEERPGSPSSCPNLLIF